MLSTCPWWTVLNKPMKNHHLLILYPQWSKMGHQSCNGLNIRANIIYLMSFSLLQSVCKYLFAKLRALVISLIVPKFVSNKLAERSPTRLESWLGPGKLKWSMIVTNKRLYYYACNLSRLQFPWPLHSCWLKVVHSNQLQRLIKNAFSELYPTAAINNKSWKFHLLWKE